MYIYSIYRGTGIIYFETLLRFFWTPTTDNITETDNTTDSRNVEISLNVIRYIYIYSTMHSFNCIHFNEMISMYQFERLLIDFHIYNVCLSDCIYGFKSGSIYTSVFNKYARIDDCYEFVVKFINPNESASINKSLFKLNGYDAINQSLQDFDIDWDAISLLNGVMSNFEINISIFFETLIILLVSLPLYSRDNKEEFPQPICSMCRFANSLILIIML